MSSFARCSDVVLFRYTFEGWIYLGKTLFSSVTSRFARSSDVGLFRYTFEGGMYLGETLFSSVMSRFARSSDGVVFMYTSERGTRLGNRLLPSVWSKFERRSDSMNFNRTFQTWIKLGNRVTWSVKVKRVILPLRRPFVYICGGYVWVSGVKRLARWCKSNWGGAWLLTCSRDKHHWYLRGAISVKDKLPCYGRNGIYEGRNDSTWSVRFLLIRITKINIRNWNKSKEL